MRKLIPVLLLQLVSLIGYASEWKETGKIEFGSGEMSGFPAFSPDRKLIALPGSNSVRVYKPEASNPSKGETVLEIPVSGFVVLAGATVRFSPNSNFISVTQLGSAEIWDISSKKQIHTFSSTGNRDKPSAVFLPDGLHVLIASAGWTKLFDLKSGQMVSKLPRASGLSSDCYYLTIYNGETKNTDIYETLSGKIVFSVPGSGKFLAGGQTLLASKGENGRIFFSTYDVATSQLKYKIDLLENQENDLVDHTYESSVDPSGRYLARVTDKAYRALSMYDMKTGEMLWKITTEPEGLYRRDLVFSPDGSELLSKYQLHGGGSKLVSIDTKTGREKEIFRVAEGSGISRIQSYGYLGDSSHIWIFANIETENQWLLFEK